MAQLHVPYVHIRWPDSLLVVYLDWKSLNRASSFLRSRTIRPCPFSFLQPKPLENKLCCDSTLSQGRLLIAFLPQVVYFLNSSSTSSSRQVSHFWSPSWAEPQVPPSPAPSTFGDEIEIFEGIPTSGMWRYFVIQTGRCPAFGSASINSAGVVICCNLLVLK